MIWKAAILGAALFGSIAWIVSNFAKPEARLHSGSGEVIIEYTSGYFPGGAGGTGTANAITNSYGGSGGNKDYDTYGGNGGSAFFNGSGGSGKTTPSEHDTRLLLQYLADYGGVQSSYPSSVSNALYPAIEKGWIDDGHEARMLMAPSGGVVTFTLTESGRTELKRLTESTPNPTRLVYGRRYLQGAGMVVYGAPVEEPLTTPYQMIDGAVVKN